MIESLESLQPANWETIKLGDAATFINGYAFKPSDWRTEGLEIIRIQNLTKSSNSVNYYDGEINSRYKVVKGDFLISWSATLGIFEWDGEDAWLNQHLFKVVFDKRKFDKSFFKHLIAMSLEEMGKQTHGSTMKHITKPRFDNFKIPYPPLVEQQKIAAILDVVNSLRQKDQQLIERYTALSQSLFLEMFGDPFEGETYMLEKNVDVVGGFAFKSSDFVDKGVPVIKIGTVNKGYFDIENFSFLPKEFLEKYRKWQVAEGDILMSLTGTVGKDDYGNVEQATDEYVSYLLNQRVAKLSPINQSYLSDFLFGMLANKKTKNELTKISRGVRQANISNKDIQQLKMIKPPISEQKKYSEAMNAIKKQKQQAQRSLEKSEALFNSLLQRAFTGELTAKMAA